MPCTLPSITIVHKQLYIQSTNLSRAVAVAHNIRMNVFLCEGIPAALRLSGQFKHSIVIDLQAWEPPELQCVNEPATVKPVRGKGGKKKERV